MTLSKERWIDDLLGKMNLEQKVGQMMVFGFAGSVITPDIIDLIRKYHIGGLRISLKFRTQNLLHDLKPGTEPNENVLRSLQYPSGKNRDYADPKQCVACTSQEYAAILNQLREYALDRDHGIPLHLTIDQEGNGSDDLLSGQRLFPNPMGITASGDPELAYRIALAIGKQARAIGANMIHSPVLDVNSNPQNPEIGPRSYSDRPDEVVQYAMQSLRGFAEAGLIATGKHFPGRGESVSDAHWDLPTVDLDLKNLQEVHIAPYTALIAAGLPAVMTAHCSYPALGVTDIPGSTAERVIKGLLREELGFQGIVTTDNMMMGGILQRFEIREAIVRAIEAGNDLVLYRDESPQRIRILDAVIAAVKEKRISEAQIDESVARILGMRWEMGLNDDEKGSVDPEKAAAPIDDPYVVKVAREAAERSVLLLRDEDELIPLKPDQKVLLVEQVFTTHRMANNKSCHPGMLWEEMCRESEEVGSVEIPMQPSNLDRQRVMRRIEEADVIVATNYYYHKAAATMTDLVRDIQRTGKPVIVITNNPFERAAPSDFPTIIIVFTAGGRENLRAAVEVVFGKRKPQARLSVRLS